MQSGTLFRNYAGFPQEMCGKNSTTVAQIHITYHNILSCAPSLVHSNDLHTWLDK